MVANCNDVLELAYDCMHKGRGYAQAYGYQCIAFIYGIVQELGLQNSIDPVAHGGLGAKLLINNECKNGWKTVRTSDFNSLPNGAITIWDATPTNAYGHVCVKIKQQGGNDTISQNWNAPNPDVGNLPRYSQSVYMGRLLGAFVSTDTKTPAQKKSSQKAKKSEDGKSIVEDIGRTFASDKIKGLFDSLDIDIKQDDAFSELKDAISNLKKNIENFIKDITTAYINTKSPSKSSNKLVTVDKVYNNMVKVHLNLSKVNNILGDFDKKEDEKKENIKKKKANTTAGQGAEKKEDNSGLGWIELVTKVVLEYVQKADAEGIAGMIGNFMHESGGDQTIISKKYEADWTGKGLVKPENLDMKKEPTVENYFGSWNYFQNVVYAGYPLYEKGYLIGDKHWIGIGIGQWTGPRCKALWDYAKSSNRNVWDLETQIRYIFKEGKAGTAKILLVDNPSPEQAAFWWLRDWEGIIDESLPNRKANARKVFPEVQKYVKKYKK